MSGMDVPGEGPLFSELIFVQESATLLDTAERAHGRMMQSIAEGNNDEFWEAVDQLLNVSIRVANIYWPASTRSKVKRRGRDLRALLQLGDAERFPGLRHIRNGFEHLDELIDDWAAATPQFYIDRAISNGPLGQMIMINGGLDEQRTARSYRSDTGELRVFNRALNVPSLIIELRELREYLRRFTSR